RRSPGRRSILGPRTAQMGVPVVRYGSGCHRRRVGSHRGGSRGAAMIAALPTLDEIILDSGAHPDREQGVCLMEAVAWVAGEPHSDHPRCVDVALAAYGRTLNDLLRDDERQLLVPLIPMLIGTRGSHN